MSTAAVRDLSLETSRISRNLSSAALVEAALRRGEGRLASNGALVASTGDRTGRSPNEKFLEDTPAIHDKIEWGKVNKPITPEQFDAIEKLARERLQTQEELHIFDGFVGADPTHRLSVTAVCEQAWHALFARTLFLRPTREELESFEPGWLILNCGAHKLTPEEQSALGLESDVCVAQSLEKKTVVIFGTEYAGEMKKSIFYAMNYDMPEDGVFPMHCSANVDPDDENNVALFFGLSGTGKTTLSADPERGLIGDDEHGWSDNGVFNFEGGCYAKVIRLSAENEPQIHACTRRFGTILENVVFDPTTRHIDLDDDILTENTRAAYPLDYIPNVVKEGMVHTHPKNIILLTCDAQGVMPPIARLSPDQALYHFISGYTSKIAGTEIGLGIEPEVAFSACFGAPFMVHHPFTYANMLKQRMIRFGAQCWLVNTGWVGGNFWNGKRISIRHTRNLLNAALDGNLHDVPYRKDRLFHFDVPKACPEVPEQVLDPSSSWGDKDEYWRKYDALVARYIENFKLFADGCPPEVVRAGPRRLTDA